MIIPWYYMETTILSSLLLNISLQGPFRQSHARLSRLITMATLDKTVSWHGSYKKNFALKLPQPSTQCLPSTNDSLSPS